MSKNSGKYSHAEAFNHMHYVCPDGHRVVIWNSRDGVTPFGMGCRFKGCGKDARHVDWHLDVRDPDYRLKDGDWFFRDGTREDAERIIRKRIADYPPPEGMIEEYGGLDAFVEEMIEDNHEFQEGWPMVEQYRKGDAIDDELQAKLNYMVEKMRESYVSVEEAYDAIVAAAKEEDVPDVLRPGKQPDTYA